MPEIVNEIPTQEELRAYFEAKSLESPFGTLDQANDQFPRNFGPEISDAYASLNPLGLREFGALGKAAIFDGLTRLNHLPRNDPFWNDTNRRPTKYKLSEFCHRLLTGNPSDKRALWTMAVNAVWNGANDFGEEYWLRLHQLGDLDERWPVLAAFVTQFNANETEQPLAEYLRATTPSEASLSFLREISEKGRGPAALWAHRVLSLVDL